jgi:hypothetical protein
MSLRILSFAALALATSIAPNSASAAHKSSPATASTGADPSAGSLRGGAGVVENGRLLSFYEAGIYVEPSSESSPDGSVSLPEVQDLFNIIAKAPFLSDQTRGTYLNTIQPSDRRKYFRAIPRDLTADVYRRIIEVFYRITGVTVDRLTLAAVTDTNTAQTFILTPFDSFSHGARLGTLFHESYWLYLQRKRYRGYGAQGDRGQAEADYRSATDAGTALEALVAAPSDRARIFAFVQFIGNDMEKQNAMVAWDFASGAMSPILRENNSANSLRLSAFYGKDAAACIDRALASNGYSWETCSAYANQNLERILAANKNSLTITAIVAAIRQDRLRRGTPYSPVTCGTNTSIYSGNCRYSDRTIRFNPGASPTESAIVVD